jgi:hypothetical protein
LVIVDDVRELDAFLNEVVHPGRAILVRKENIASFDQGADRVRTHDLATLRVYWEQPRNLKVQHLNYCRASGLVLDQLGDGFWLSLCSSDKD